MTTTPKPPDFEWILTPPTGSTATIDSPGDLITSLTGIDVPGTYKLKARCSTADEGKTLSIIIPKVDLDIFDFDAAASRVEVPDEDEETVGAMVLVNDDDDNENEVNDLDPSETTISGEDDLQKIIIRAVEPASYSGSVALTFPPSVGVYENANKSGEVAAGATFAQSDLPKTLWVEGRTVSTSHNDIEITITSPEGCQDTVALTAVRASFLYLTTTGGTVPDSASDAFIPSLSADLVHDVAEAENGPWPTVGGGGPVTFELGTWEGIPRTDLSEYRFKVQVEDARVTTDTTTVDLEVSGGSTLTVVLQRQSGNTFSSSAEDFLHVTGYAPGDLPDNLAGTTTILGDFSGKAKLRVRKGTQRSSAKRRQWKGIRYYKYARSQDTNGNIRNPACIPRTGIGTFYVRHTGVDTNNIEWELVGEPVGTALVGADASGIARGAEVQVQAGNADGSFSIIITARGPISGSARKVYRQQITSCRTVELIERNVYLYIVAKDDGSDPAVAAAVAAARIARANVVWRQAGIHFNIAATQQINNTDFLDLQVAELPDLLDEDPGDGFEIYFVETAEKVDGSPSAPGFVPSNREGIVITAIGAADQRVVAHELGHAMGLWPGNTHPDITVSIGCVPPKAVADTADVSIQEAQLIWIYDIDHTE